MYVLMDTNRMTVHGESPTAIATNDVAGDRFMLPNETTTPKVRSLTAMINLQNATLLQFLATDPRPTFVLEVHPTKQIIYQNDALERQLGSWRAGKSNFHIWALETSFDDLTVAYRFEDRDWTAVPLSSRWTVVSMCCQAHGKAHYTPAHSVAPVTPREPVLEGLPRPHSVSQSLSGSETSSSSEKVRVSTSVARSTASSSGNTVSGDGNATSHDWTRHPLRRLSTHVQLILDFPWEDTPIGSIESWPDALRQLVLAMMNNSEPRVVMWGSERRMIYNEACCSIFGHKHPGALGARAEEIWSESWSSLEVIVSRAEKEGKPTRIAKMPLTMNRYGYNEETHWSLQMVPVIGPEGQVLGVLDEFAESTDHILQERRRDAIVRINQMVANVTNMKELCFEFLEGLEKCRDDVPYALVYTPDIQSDSHRRDAAHGSADAPARHCYVLEGSIGITAGSVGIPECIDLAAPQDNPGGLLASCIRAFESGEAVVLRDDSLPEELAVVVPGRVGGEKVKTVCVLPVPNYDGRIVSFLIVATTPRRPYDSDSLLFVHYLRDILAKSASAIVLPEEQRRARQKFEEIETSMAHQLRATALEAERIEARFARMTQIAPVGMYAISGSSSTLFYNEAYLSITGITKEEAEDPGRDPIEAIHPDDRERVLQMWLTSTESKEAFTAEYRVIKPWIHVDPTTGEEITSETWVLACAQPELDDKGQLVHIQGWLLDISDRKYHERLRIKRAHNEKAAARFARLAETAPLGMYLLRIDGRPIYLNDAYFDLLGFTRSDFEEAESRGVGWADRIHDDDRERVNEAWVALVNQGTPLDLEYRIKKPWKAYDTATGTEMSGPTWLQGTAVAEMDDEGNPIAVQGFVTEISLKKFSERLLTDRLEDALETKLQADRFIDMVSHEVRNPLSAILQSADGILTSMESSGLPILEESMTLTQESAETVIDSAQTIILCAQHQKRIVDDILTLSKLDSNLLVISPDRTSTPTLLAKTFKMYDSELARCSIAADLILEESYNRLAVEDVMLDSSRMLQVVINLVTNAIKFTQYSERREIKIYLGASKVRPASNSHCSSFIPARANRPDHTASPEWGQGEEVYLEIAVEDSGRGLTEEELKLLFQRFQQASPKTYKQYGGSGLGLFISRELTELQGGQIGVSSKAGEGSTFAFYVKARRCVSHANIPAQNGRLPTPTLNSSPVSYARAGSITSIDGVISEASNDPGDNPSHLKRSTGGGPSTLQVGPLHVLVVEDNLVNQRVMAQQLKRLGCLVHVANHGIEALEFLQRTTFWNPDAQLQAASLEPMPPSAPRSSSPAIPLSVILMDLEMPVLGGLGCVKQIRDMQRGGQLTGHVPVIAVTANARSEQIAIAIEHGMDSVVTKPFRIPELVPQMQSLVARVYSEVGE